MAKCYLVKNPKETSLAQNKPKKSALQSILNFSKSYEVRPTKKGRYLEVMLN